MNQSWLNDVIVVNENDLPTEAGDLQVYRNQGDLGRQLEHWHVEEVAHLALTGTGDRAILGLRGKVVVVQRSEPFAEGAELLRNWLTAAARHLLSVRMDRAHKGKLSLGELEAQGVLPESIEGLIAYVGFE